MRHQLKNFPRYMDRSVLYRLHYQGLPYVFPEDDEESTYVTHRFSLKCRLTEINYAVLLKAICKKDWDIKPSLSHRVYFVNSKRRTIFHVYDDRGCDLLATSPETISEVYHRFNDWILDYDRARVDEVFK